MRASSGVPSLLEYTQDKVAVVDEDGRHVYVNAAAERILGYAPDDLVGEDAFEYVHPEERTEARELFHSVIGAETVTTEIGRFRHRTRDGRWVWLESRFSNVSDPALGGYVVSSRDVTEQVEARREREETRRMLEEVTRSTPEVMWMFDADWTEVLFVNPAFESVYGMATERLREDPRRVLEAIHPDDVPCVEAAMERLSDGESVDVEYRVNERRNYRNWVWVQGEPVTEGGEVTRIVGFSRDVTDRKRRERQLAVMDNLLRHTVKNDMTVVLGNAEFITEHSDEDVSSKADIIRRTSKRLVQSAEKQREIINLLTRPARTVTLDLVASVTDAIAQVAERNPAATIETRLPDSAGVCALNEIQLAVTELVENAIRHDQTDEPEVVVTVRRGAGPVELEIRDNCPPIPEREYRVLTGEREMCEMYHTTGLGLWLVYWIVDLSGGEIRFDRREAVGNEISIDLPRAAGPAS